jgi:hypothetical protein
VSLLDHLHGPICLPKQPCLSIYVRRYEFVTSLMAIIGGTFTVLGLIDGVLHKVSEG